MSLKSDVDRWKKFDLLSKDWSGRSDRISQFLIKDKVVLDLGCGRQYVETLLDGGRYLPVDIVARDERTYVIDLNVDILPAELLYQVEISVCLGVLEYLLEPFEVLETLVKYSERVILTYKLHDYVSDLQVRESAGWKNSLTRSELLGFVAQKGYDVVHSEEFDDQILLVIDNAITNPNPDDISINTIGKDKLILSGFFGRGNAGDESFVQVQYEFFKEYFDIIISVEQSGAYNGFWDWYPYNQCEIIGRSDLSKASDKSVIGMHLGGGSLYPTYAASQMSTMAMMNKKTAISGVEQSVTIFEQNGALSADYLSYLGTLDYYSVRNAFSHELNAQHDVNSNLGGDWATGMLIDNADMIDEVDIVLVVREFATWEIDKTFLSSLAQLVDKMDKLGRKMVLLPFCPEDERFIKNLNMLWNIPTEVHWWNPRRVMQIIKKSNLVLSIGRLHAAIFSMLSGTACVTIFPALSDRQELLINKKLQINSNEMDIDFYPDITSFLLWLDEHSLDEVSSEYKANSVYQKRFNSMKNDLLNTFLS